LEMHAKVFSPHGTKQQIFKFWWSYTSTPPHIFLV
jgi:hypothetical protein